MIAGCFIVVFDDQHCVCWPMGWDANCTGAICTIGREVALFPDRAAARKAIRISTAYAKLRRAQGLPANDDFLEGLKFVRAIPATTQPRTTTES